MVNGRNAMAVHSLDIYFLLKLRISLWYVMNKFNIVNVIKRSRVGYCWAWSVAKENDRAYTMALVRRGLSRLFSKEYKDYFMRFVYFLGRILVSVMFSLSVISLASIIGTAR